MKATLLMFQPKNFFHAKASINRLNLSTKIISHVIIVKGRYNRKTAIMVGIVKYKLSYVKMDNLFIVVLICVMFDLSFNMEVVLCVI